jgi:hypothetical protein
MMGPSIFIMMFFTLHIMLMLLMIPYDSILLSYKPCETIHAKLYELHNWLFNELNNKPYLNYEWEMEMKQRHMNQSIVIIIVQSWTSLFQKE